MFWSFSCPFLRVVGLVRVRVLRLGLCLGLCFSLGKWVWQKPSVACLLNSLGFAISHKTLFHTGLWKEGVSTSWERLCEEHYRWWAARWIFWAFLVHFLLSTCCCSGTLGALCRRKREIGSFSLTGLDYVDAMSLALKVLVLVWTHELSKQSSKRIP